MAGFQRPADALTAAFAMHEETRRLTVPGTEGAIEIKYGLHTGPAIAVNLNERVDYFGQTVNMAARIQSIAKKNEICFSSAVFEDERTRSYLEMLRPAGLRRMRVRLKGIEAEQVVYAWAGG
jgi:class 3 adenylate cyclase